MLTHGWSFRRILRETGVRRETISKYAGKVGSVVAARADPPVFAPDNATKVEVHSTSRSAAAAYQAVVVEKLARHSSCRKIFHDLVAECGYSHSYESVKRYVRKLCVGLVEPRAHLIAGACWVGDCHEAALLFDPLRQGFASVCLCAFIDHETNLIAHAEWYVSEDEAALQDALERAILKRGVPGRVYLDAGGLSRSTRLARALDRLGIGICHRGQALVYAAIERWHRRVTEEFEPETRMAQPEGLDRLNFLFDAWLRARCRTA